MAQKIVMARQAFIWVTCAIQSSFWPQLRAICTPVQMFRTVKNAALDAEEGYQPHKYPQRGHPMLLQTVHWSPHIHQGNL